MSIRVVIADDHQLFLKSLSLLVGQLPGFTIVGDAVNGKLLLDKINSDPQGVDLALIDVGMPVMDGIETTRALRFKWPHIKVVALSMNDDEFSILGMIRAGANAYLLKDIHPDELEKALIGVHKNGYYNPEDASKSVRPVTSSYVPDSEKDFNITKNEIDFLNYACSDMTYKQIAAIMNLSHRTIDGYREVLFDKLNVQSRTGMIIEALRRKLIEID